MASLALLPVFALLRSQPISPHRRCTATVRCAVHATGRSILPVTIDITGVNSRRISASIVIASTVDEVWRVVTDYDNLASCIPNLVRSYRVPAPAGGLRVYQEGAQYIAGFDFRAALTMDMQEERVDFLGRRLPAPRIAFSCYASEMFDVFTGEWRLEPLEPGGSTSTRLSYRVDITPKGMVPVLPLEWRIREDVPLNLNALKRTVEQTNRRVVEAE